MTNKQIENRQNLINAIHHYANANGKDVDYFTAYKIANRLHRYEAILSRIAEMECSEKTYNLYWKDGVNPDQERWENIAEKYVRENIGCPVHTQRDPRGFCLRLHLKCEANENFYNTWDGETSGCNW